MTIRLCPSCARRWAMIPAADCPVCQGVGSLTLGRGGMAKFGAEVASLAVEFALEAQARADLGQRHADLAAARKNQTATVRKMRSVGLLAKQGVDTGPAKVKVMTIAQARAHAMDLAQANAEDRWRLESRQLPWTPDDRPLASGGLPGFSNAGFVAHLTRVNDPQDPLEMGGIQRQAQTRRRALRDAEALATSLPLFNFPEQQRA